jgi:IgA Peptidase M64
VVDQDGHLFERFWNGSQWVWVDHGRPPGTSVSTAPGAAMMNQKLFVGTANQRLFERFWDGSQWVWVDHGTLLHDNSTTLLDNSALGRRRTLVVVGDGFDEATLDSFRGWVQREVMDGVFARDVFRERSSAFNVIRIDLVSVDRGVSQKRYDEKGTPFDPSDDTVSSETARNTRLRYVYSGSWAHVWLEESSAADPRLSTMGRLLKVLRRFVPNYDDVLVVLNEGGRGGAGWPGQQRQVVTLNAGWPTVAHEFGHGMAGLQDEYEQPGTTFPGGWIGPNCSASGVRPTLKWADLVAATTALPTPENIDSTWNANTDVGAFAGCGTFETGLFRPVKECRMNRTEANPFCPVCARVFRAVLAQFS